jgi:muramoyltetrapeptide carboxypeptidase
MTGAILCVEEDETTNVATVDRYLTQLRQMGVYQQIATLVVGRFPSATGFSEEDPLETVLTIATRGYSFPVVYDVDFGHTDPMMILANGVLGVSTQTTVSNSSTRSSPSQSRPAMVPGLGASVH